MENTRISELSAGIVHVWPVHIYTDDVDITQFYRVLTAEEVHRAKKFYFDHLQRAFIVTRGVLRFLLGSYLEIHPAAVQFVYSSKGKPRLVEGLLEFNVSHSAELTVLAFAFGCEIGIDVERIRFSSYLEEIANRFFCVEEFEELIALPAAERERAFFMCWTRKEAYLKAIGDGLSTPLNSVRVSLNPREPARFVHVGNDICVAKEWALHDLELAPCYAGALAYHDAPRPIVILPAPKAVCNWT